MLASSIAATFGQSKRLMAAEALLLNRSISSIKQRRVRCYLTASRAEKLSKIQKSLKDWAPCTLLFLWPIYYHLATKKIMTIGPQRSGKIRELLLSSNRSSFVLFFLKKNWHHLYLIKFNIPFFNTFKLLFSLSFMVFLLTFLSPGLLHLRFSDTHW